MGERNYQLVLSGKVLEGVERAAVVSDVQEAPPTSMGESRPSHGSGKYSDDDQKVIEDRLRDLGYIE